MISSISLADVFIFSSEKIVKNCKIFIFYLVRFRISAFWNTESGESRTLNCSRRCHFCNFLSQVIPAYSSLKITLLIQPFFMEISEITRTEKYFILQETEFEGMLNQNFEILKFKNPGLHLFSLEVLLKAKVAILVLRKDAWSGCTRVKPTKNLQAACFQ